MWDCAVRQSGACDAPLHFPLNSHFPNRSKTSVFSVSFVVFCVKKLHHKNQNHQSKQYSISLNPSKPPSGLSELSGSVVNKNTASQSPKPLIAAVQRLSKPSKTSVFSVSFVVLCVKKRYYNRLSVALSGIECGIVLLGNRAHAMCRYNSRSNRITITKKRQSQQHCLSPNLQKTPSGLSELSGSVVNKNTASQKPKTPIAAALHLSKPFKTSVFSVSFVVLCVKKRYYNQQNR
jgi:hypothetical protein